MERIKMIDLSKEYELIKDKIDAAILSTISSGGYIQGEEVTKFEKNLSQYTDSKYVISCGNGTDALLAALMALDIKQNDEVITVPFTFISTIEVISLLGAKPVFVDVSEETFNLNPDLLEAAITDKTKAIIPVHLYGQCADMEKILNIANKHNIKVIEDCCQALGTDYMFSDGRIKKAGTMGIIGCTSFFPTKNLGCFGDGGAIFTQDKNLAEKLRMICKHGSKIKYEHEIIGINSRLDTIQAAILNIKLQYLEKNIKRKQKIAEYYFDRLKNLDWIKLPKISKNSTHTFHQFTIKTDPKIRERFKAYLSDNKIDTMIYYPTPAHFQEAYKNLNNPENQLHISEKLSKEVLSIPINSTITDEEIQYICETIVNFQL